MPVEGYLEVGQVAKPHGVRGEVKVRLHWAESDTLFGVESVVLRQAGSSDRPFRVQGARRTNKFVVLKLESIDHREAAVALRGAAVAVARDCLPQLDRGEYYLCDLVGARVQAPSGLVGEVVEVRPYPSVDVILVRTPEGKLVEQPLAEPWLESVDTPGGCVRLSSTDGLIE